MANTLPTQAIAYWVGILERYVNLQDPAHEEALEYATGALFRHAEQERAKKVAHYLAMAEEYRGCHGS